MWQQCLKKKTHFDFSPIIMRWTYSLYMIKVTKAWHDKVTNTSLIYQSCSWEGPLPLGTSPSVGSWWRRRGQGSVWHGGSWWCHWPGYSSLQPYRSCPADRPGVEWSGRERPLQLCKLKKSKQCNPSVCNVCVICVFCRTLRNLGNQKKALHISFIL